MTEQVGTEKEKDVVDELNKVDSPGTDDPVKNTADNPEGNKPDEKPAMELELETLRRENLDQQTRINQYDGERSQMSQKMNNLQETVDGLISKQTEPDNDSDLDDPVTKGELDKYKKGEIGRFEQYEAKKSAEDQTYGDEYTKSLGTASLGIKNEDTFKAILKEHDALQRSGYMPESTGDAKIDGQIGWNKAENAYLKKMNAAGKQISFNANVTTTATGVGSSALDDPVKKETTKMPPLSADSQQLLNDLGEAGNADFVNKALGKA